jgi:hypothetical protein
MSEKVLDALAGAGIALALVDGELIVECAAEPPPVLRELLRLAKRELTALLLAERAPAMWDKHDWRAHFAERAATLEVDCGLKRAQAETEALHECLHLYAGRRPK